MIKAGRSAQWYDPYISSYGSEEPSQFAKAMAKTVSKMAGGSNLLDIGCGCGIIGIYCLLEHSAQSVTFTDLFPKWLDITKSNIDIKVRTKAIMLSQVSFLEAGSFTDIPREVIAQHSLLAFNPPQLPTAYVDEETLLRLASDPIQNGFRVGGRYGLAIARKFLRWYAALTMPEPDMPKPDAVILLSSFLGRRRINQVVASYGLEVKGGCPVETPARLRKMFWKKADEFSSSPAEIADRSLERDDEGWTKKLLTFRLNNEPLPAGHTEQKNTPRR